MSDVGGPTRTDPIVPEGDEPEKDPRARETTLLEAALAYAARGWPVLPCQAHKKPIGRLVPHGLLDATTNPAKIRAWWKAEPEALIGGVTGGGTQKLVVDVDVKAGVDGYATLSELEAKHGPLPMTVTATTPSGGQHHYLLNTGLDVKSRAEALGPGLDIRADGAYAILPPSRVPHVGAYEWLAGHSPDERDLAVAPAWLGEVAKRRPASPPQVSASVLTGLLNNPPTEGQRHDWLTSVAGSYASSTDDYLRIPPKANTLSAPSRTPVPVKPNTIGAQRRVCSGDAYVLFGFRSTRGALRRSLAQ